MYNKIVIFLIGIILLFMACASVQYSTADKYLNKNDYQNALKEYIRIAELKSPLSVSRDIRALNGAMIAYYNLGDYKNSFALGKRILTINKYHSSAIFHTGLNLEKLGKQTLAKKIFQYYSVLSRNDPYYKFIKAKFNEMVQAEMEQQAKMAIQMENSFSPDQINDNTIAVLYFLNILEDPEWNSLGKGLAEMMITDLSQVSKLKVLERIQLQKLIEEIGIGMSGLADEKTVPRMGKLLKAKTLVNGAFSIKAGRRVAITSDLVDITSSQDFQKQNFSGDINELFKIEKQLVFMVLEELGIQLTQSEKKSIGKFATRNFNAFKAFCYGLDNYDLGNYKLATSYFQESLRYDPGFQLAQNMFDITDAMGVMAQGDLSFLHLRSGDGRTSKVASMSIGGESKSVSESSVRDRLEQISTNLDLGYLPGIDSRNGASEIISEETFLEEGPWQRPSEKLPLPPKPPTTPPN